MEIQVRKIPMPKVCEYTMRDLCNFSVPSFIYGDLICLKSNDKAGCISEKTGRVIIPFKYDEILIAKNGIIKAYYFDKDTKKIDFYDYSGKFLTDYYYIENAVEHEKYYIYEDEIDISVLTYEDYDEETYSYSCMSKHILYDGRVTEIWGRELENKEKEPPALKGVIHYPINFQELTTYEVVKLKNRVRDNFEKSGILSDMLPYDDPNWVMIDGIIYYTDEGQLSAFDVYGSREENLFKAYIELAYSGGKTYSSSRRISCFVEKGLNYNLIFEKDHLVAVSDDMCAVEIQFGKAKRHKFFISEEAADEYISEFEEDILDKILKD